MELSWNWTFDPTNPERPLYHWATQPLSRVIYYIRISRVVNGSVGKYSEIIGLDNANPWCASWNWIGRAKNKQYGAEGQGQASKSKVQRNDNMMLAAASNQERKFRQHNDGKVLSVTATAKLEKPVSK